jgi:hypothetical protein
MGFTSFPYDTAEYETIPCDLCLRSSHEILHKRDRNGLAVQTCICRDCGLIFINPRMTKEWYVKYYQREYRDQVARFKKGPLATHNHAALFERGTKHGAWLCTLFRDNLKRGLTVEVGSSVGGVLNGFRESLDVDVLGIEPSRVEADYAMSRGIRTHPCAIEECKETVPRADNIVCTQSLNHFLSPRYFLKWAFDNLSENGKLILEVLNFRHVFRHFGYIGRAIQVDHTYMFVPEVLLEFVRYAGFAVIWMDVDENKGEEAMREQRRAGLPGFHMRVVAEKGGGRAFEDDVSREETYRITGESLRKMPNSRLRYWFKYEFKKALRRRVRNPFATALLQ